MVARNKLVIEGTLGASGAESFSFGLHYAEGAEPLQETAFQLQAWANSVATNIEGMASTHPLLVSIGPDADVTAVRTYYYAGPGSATAAGYEPVSPAKGGAGTTTLPFQVSRVISLLTPLAGRRYRGRMYIPQLTGGINDLGKQSVTAGVASAWATTLKTWGVVNGTPGGLVPAVYSAAGEVLTAVSSLSIGDVLDTQRRRTKSILEVRQTAAL